MRRYWDFRSIQNGFTELHWAIICGRDRIIRYLLKSGADVKAIDKVSTSKECMVLPAVLDFNTAVYVCSSMTRKYSENSSLFYFSVWDKILFRVCNS